MSIADNISGLRTELERINVKLVAVSKTKSADDIMQAYEAGQRIFGENQVQELAEKHRELPADIAWHQVGHLQTNKVKTIAPFISLIHSVDSLKLLKEINKHAKTNNRVIDCLLQIYIADEDTKFGLDFAEAVELLRSTEFAEMENVRITGLMGIASNTDNQKRIKDEFYELNMLFKGLKESFFADKDYFKELSMGMSADYKLAVENGSTMVRLGSTIFGNR